jgi:hypothetical protein
MPGIIDPATDHHFVFHPTMDVELGLDVPPSSGRRGRRIDKRARGPPTKYWTPITGLSQEFFSTAGPSFSHCASRPYRVV